MFLDYLSLLVKSARPKQWIKNLLVAAAPIAAGQFGSQINNIALGVIGFTSASIFGYLINDWKDREADQSHPIKKFRPFASGKLKLPSLILLLSTSLIMLIFICLILPSEFTFTIFIYLLITLTYTLFIKSLVVIEMVWLASGFLVRAVGGSAIIQEPPTGWFIISIGFGALFIVSAKRIAEIRNKNSNRTRTVISKYNENFLNLVLMVSASITLLTYSLWIFEVYPKSNIAQFTIFPFTSAIFIYAWHCNNGDTEFPEVLIYQDKVFLLCAFAIAIPLLFVIY